MAIQATSRWRIRQDGNDDNGGGYDPGIAGAGTEYTDQAAARLTLTDLATPSAGSTTLTSAAGGFASDMVGNAVKITAGTNFTTGYYFVTGFTDPNTVTLDRSPTPSLAGSAGSGKLGGAFASFGVFANGGTRGTPAVATPLAAGHEIHVRGAGTDDPGIVDYDYSAATTNWTFPGGNATDGKVLVIGYNGRPRIDVAGLLFSTTNDWWVENVKIVAQGATSAASGIFNGTNHFNNVIYDQNNFDLPLTVNTLGVYDSAVRCTGNTGGGTLAAIQPGTAGATIEGNRITSKGVGILLDSVAAKVVNNVIWGCRSFGIQAVSTSPGNGACIRGNVIDGGSSEGLRVQTVSGVNRTLIRNNIISHNTGTGLTAVAGTTASNTRLARGLVNHNAFFNNGAGGNTHRGSMPAGANDVILTVDPYVNRAAGDFTLNATAGGGAACKDAGFPQTLRS